MNPNAVKYDLELEFLLDLKLTLLHKKIYLFSNHAQLL